MNSDDHKRETRLIHAGRNSAAFGGTVNPPIQRASTILAEQASGLYSGPKSLYGRMGLQVHDALKAGLCELENATHCQLAANGLNSCALALSSVLESGDHLIASDSIYGPTRRFCESYLARMGVETTFLHPRAGRDISQYAKENTRAIFLEMPGSLTFELHDIEPIVAFAQSKDIITILDNTWGAGILFRPLEHGIDMSLQALTKYVIGHSDGFGGAVMTRSPALAIKLERTAQDWGISMSPDDAYLAQRGIRSLSLRMQTQGASSLKVAAHLESHPMISKVLHPALPNHPDYSLWKKYYDGPAGLFGFCLQPMTDNATSIFLETLNLFGFGFSWGGFESLMIPCDPQLHRSVSPEWDSGNHGPLIRVSIGLENPHDLIADLDAALSACANAQT